MDGLGERLPGEMKNVCETEGELRVARLRRRKIIFRPVDKIFQSCTKVLLLNLFLAVCALVGCVMMGPRIGRFDKHGRVVPMPGHSVPLSALGGLVLIFGFFACNGTKQVKIIF